MNQNYRSRDRMLRRDAGVRQARRVTGWTAAALIAGTAASAGYFAHVAAPPAGTTAGTSVPGSAQGSVPGAGQHRLTHTVVTSGGSGVAAGGSATGGAAGGGTSSGSGGAVTWRDN